MLQKKASQPWRERVKCVGERRRKSKVKKIGKRLGCSTQEEITETTMMSDLVIRPQLHVIVIVNNA